jgi:molybdopterin-guanine dinucleotide biosynthesis protein MobB
VAETRIVSIIGRKRSGKTTLAVALAAEFVRKGRRVMTIKHSALPVEMDRPGSDSYLAFHDGKAERTLVIAPGVRVLFERHADDTDPVTLARRYFDGADIVLVEGFRLAAIPKIEVFRREVSPTPIFDPALPSAGEWIAIVTDDDRFEASAPVLRFRDTMWLHLLASMAWDKARVI